MTAALSACSDLPTPVQPPAEGPRRSVTTQPAEWRGYWRNANELWVYDMTPEIGINSAFGDAPTVSRFRNAGMRLVRYWLPWYEYANCPGCFGWAVDQAASVGAEPVVIVSGPRDAAMQLTNPSNATERNAVYQQLATDMEDMVRRFPHVKFWQLWNEVDASCEPGKFFNGSNAYGNSTYLYPNRYVQGRNYADMLRIVYPRMKAAARAQGREVWVLTAGFTGKEGINQRVQGSTGGTDCIGPNVVSWEFVRGMYENGGKQYFDIFAIHTYGTLANSSNSMLDLGHMANYQLHTTMGDPNRPMWVTEFGTSAANSVPLLDPNRDQSQDGPLFDEIQRQWYESALAVQRDGNHLQKILGYAYVSPEGGAVPGTGIANAPAGDYGLGIFRSDNNTPRPAFVWLQNRAWLNDDAEQLGTRTGVFRIRTSGQVPLDHPYYYDGDVIVVQNVQVNTLYPTVIRMGWPSDPGPGDPGDPSCGSMIVC